MLKRSITGLILGIIMIGSLLFSKWSAIVLLLIILFFSSREWNTHFAKREGPVASLSFIFSSVIICVVTLFNILNQDNIPSLVPLNAMLVFIIFVFGLWVILRKEWLFCQSWYSGLFYISFPVILTCLYLSENFQDNRWIVLGLIIINWSNDVFAYFTGMLTGKHKLAADISPKKTIEGALGGLTAAIICAWIVNQQLFISPFPISQIMLLGFAIWCSGTLGDLYESKLKRQIKIKDSGQILPGHGGFLDRFDSFFFIIPVGIFVLSF